MNALPDHAAFEVALPTVRRHHDWTLRRDADFLNFLCPSGGDLSDLFPEEHANDDGEPHPFVSGSEAWIKGRLKSAFRDMRALYDLARYETDLTKSEMKVLQAIERKTFNFRKIFEKIPGSVFIDGQREKANGELALDEYGIMILPPTGIKDRGNVSTAVRRLVEKGMITRIEADTHPKYGATNIYAPHPPETIRDTFLRHLQDSPSRQETFKLDRETHARMVRKLAGQIRQATETMIA